MSIYWANKLISLKMIRSFWRDKTSNRKICPKDLLPKIKSKCYSVWKVYTLSLVFLKIFWCWYFPCQSKARKKTVLPRLKSPINEQAKEKINWLTLQYQKHIDDDIVEEKGIQNHDNCYILSFFDLFLNSWMQWSQHKKSN
jgi:hypothetical protein